MKIKREENVGVVTAALTVMATLAERNGWGSYTVTAAEGAEKFFHELANDCPVDLACEYAWGITKEEFDEAIAADQDLRREIRRLDAALKKGLVQAGIRRAREGDTNASRLHLQALMPEKYVPTQKQKVTVDDLRTAVEGASTEELKRLAGDDSGASPG